MLQKKCVVIWLHAVYLGQLVTSPRSCLFFCFKAKCTAADVGTAGFLATFWFDSNIISNTKTKSSEAFDDQWLWVTIPPLPKPFLPGNPVHAYNRGVVLLRLNQWQAASRDFDLAAPWFLRMKHPCKPPGGLRDFPFSIDKDGFWGARIFAWCICIMHPENYLYNSILICHSCHNCTTLRMEDPSYNIPSQW